LLLTPVSSLLTPISSLLTPVSSLLTPHREQTSPSHPGCGLSPTPLQPCSPTPPHQGGEGGSSVDPSGRSEFSATPSRTPRHLTSPSLGSDSGLAVQDGTAVLPGNPSLAPRDSAPPLTGRGLGAGWIRINIPASATCTSVYCRNGVQFALLG
jgi:hypothetical protein